MKTYFLQLPYFSARNPSMPMCVTITEYDAERLVKEKTHRMFTDTVDVIYVVSPCVPAERGVEFQLGQDGTF